MSSSLTPRAAAWAARALKGINPALSSLIADMAGDYIPLSAYDTPSDALWRWCDVFDEKNVYTGILVDVQGANCLVLSPDTRELQQARIGNVHPIPGSDPVYDGESPRGLTLEALPTEPEEKHPDNTSHPNLNAGNQTMPEPVQQQNPSNPVPVERRQIDDTTQMQKIPDDPHQRQRQGGLSSLWGK